jgi:hypothetical protein
VFDQPWIFPKAFFSSLRSYRIQLAISLLLAKVPRNQNSALETMFLVMIHHSFDAPKHTGLVSSSIARSLIPIIGFHGHFDRSGFNLCFFFKKRNKPRSRPFCILYQVTARWMLYTHGEIKALAGICRKIIKGELWWAFLTSPPDREFPSLKINR